LKEEGNNYFKERKYDLAIKAYSDALALTDVDSHLLFSNRSAAYTSMNAFAEAMSDAKKCIELKPEWSKGYFRLGKALYQNEEISEAFINFYHGLLLEPKSDELRKMVEQTRQR
jgi:stress-induced-phosphoprotein 1